MNTELIQRAAAYPYIIWDMDGTILDSMPYWVTLSADYLKTKGIEPPPDLNDITDSMTLEESAVYFRTNFGIALSNDEIIAEVMELITEEYRTKIPMKAFAGQIVRTAAENGAKMCVLTTSRREAAENALARIGLLSCFERVISASDLEMDKRSPAIYEKTAEIMHYDLSETLICEDALYAIKSASETAADVMAFRDDYNTAEWEDILRYADFAEN